MNVRQLQQEIRLYRMGWTPAKRRAMRERYDVRRRARRRRS